MGAEMLRYIATGMIVLALAAGFRGVFVWAGCGYDCPAIPFPTLTATGAMLLALLAGVVGLVALVASLPGSASGRD